MKTKIIFYGIIIILLLYTNINFAKNRKNQMIKEKQIKYLFLKRFFTNSEVTYGVLYSKKHPICLTLELSWRFNEIKNSCIPAGIYTCKKIEDKAVFCSYTYELQNVPGRSGIRIHPGAHPGDTQGCILVGRYFDPSVKIPSLRDSAKAFYAFQAELNDAAINNRVEVEEFILIIQNCY